MEFFTSKLRLGISCWFPALIAVVVLIVLQDWVPPTNSTYTAHAVTKTAKTESDIAINQLIADNLSRKDEIYRLLRYDGANSEVSKHDLVFEYSSHLKKLEASSLRIFVFHNVMVSEHAVIITKQSDGKIVAMEKNAGSVEQVILDCCTQKDLITVNPVLSGFGAPSQYTYHVDKDMNMTAKKVFVDSNDSKN